MATPMKEREGRKHSPTEANSWLWLSTRHVYFARLFYVSYVTVDEPAVQSAQVHYTGVEYQTVMFSEILFLARQQRDLPLYVGEVCEISFKENNSLQLRVI